MSPASAPEASAPGAPDPAAAHRRALAAAVVANVALASLHVAGYLGAVPEGASGRGPLALALVAEVAAAFVVAAALLLPLARGAPGRALLLAAAPLVMTALHLFFFVDRKLYAAMGMHVNALVLDVVLTQGGLGALGASAGAWAGLAMRWGAVLALEAAGFVGLARAARRAPGRLRAVPTWLHLAAAVVVLLSLERIVYAVVTVAAAGDGSAAQASPGWAAERRLWRRPAEPMPVRYPRAPLQLTPGAPRPNLVWIVIESWRRDALGADVTPVLHRQSLRSLTFRNHVSGGNGSIGGVYSQFFGLHGNAVAALQRDRQRPLLLRVLQQLGYRVGVSASPELGYGHMRDAVFGDVAGPASAAPGDTPTARDRAAAAQAAAFLRAARPGEPFALFVLLDGTHIPYHFDPARSRYRPFEPELDVFALERARSPERLRNRYLNALAEVDAAAGVVLDALEGTGLAGETVTVVIGDHGEQLLDHGKIGHQLSLCAEETETPLLLRVPGVAPVERDDLSRHVDLPPTILGLLGVTNPPADYSAGRSLLHDPPPDFAVLVGFRHAGVRTPDGWTVEWDTEHGSVDPTAGYRVRDPAYRLRPGPPPHPEALAAGLADLHRFSR